LGVRKKRDPNTGNLKMAETHRFGRGGEDARGKAVQTKVNGTHQPKKRLGEKSTILNRKPLRWSPKEKGPKKVFWKETTERGGGRKKTGTNNKKKKKKHTRGGGGHHPTNTGPQNRGGGRNRVQSGKSQQGRKILGKLKQKKKKTTRGARSCKIWGTPRALTGTRGKKREGLVVGFATTKGFKKKGGG